MKRILSIAVLILLMVHFIGFYVYFATRQFQIHQQMREHIAQLPDHQLEIFKFTRGQYQRVRVNDSEIKVDGKMYDHSSPQWEGDHVILHARHDEAEDNLIAFLEEIIHTQSTDDRPVPSQLMSFFSLVYLPVEGSFRT
jgi:hypothetical protein